MSNNKKALIAMSGGVDSSVAALLIRERGMEAVGCTMRLFENDMAGAEQESTCCSLDDVEDARAVAGRVGIPFYVFNYKEKFSEQVIGRFAADYCSGRTPNPCIDCNKYLKFGALMQRAAELGCDYVVTGHYARIGQDEQTGRYTLKKAADPSKDQSYVLYNLTQEQLAHVLFPLGEITKEKAREIAQEHGFVNAGKHDSQDICFAPDGDYAAAIRRYLAQSVDPEASAEMISRAFTPGKFVDSSGSVLGTHTGLANYTIGQRRGLGIPAAHRLFVQKLDMEKNAVVLGTNEELFSREVLVDNVNWISGDTPSEPVKCKTKIRYRHTEQPCTVYPEGTCARIVFEEAQRAATPGQSAVFYDGDVVLGGGIIR
ncbi:MAG: tRNA 2-thiouridine(34) synthase MnmA [Lachnospiraceae bacterium]|nr:tRNA 2-thiouridine(34) synthase MnmA [Lachnospiraceae bacterium]